MTVWVFRTWSAWVVLARVPPATVLPIAFKPTRTRPALIASCTVPTLYSWIAGAFRAGLARRAAVACKSTPLPESLFTPSHKRTVSQIPRRTVSASGPLRSFMAAHSRGATWRMSGARGHLHRWGPLPAKVTLLNQPAELVEGLCLSPALLHLQIHHLDELIHRVDQAD